MFGPFGAGSLGAGKLAEFVGDWTTFFDFIKMAQKNFMTFWDLSLPTQEDQAIFKKK